jgi:hypothetical protein
MVSEMISPPAEPPPAAVTVITELAETVPAKPAAVAVIVAVPADCPVTSPVVGFTDATVGVFEVQFTRVVTF